MNERLALLHAVAVNPDEDTPRLVFADWLDENGDHERAAFIRFQVELALLRASGSERAVRNLLRRVASVRRVEAFRSRAGSWAASGFEVNGTPDTGRGEQQFWGQPASGTFLARWSRGFVGHLEVSERIGRVVQVLIGENPVTRFLWRPVDLASFRFPRFELPGHVRRFVIEIIPWRSGFLNTVSADDARRIHEKVGVTDQTRVVVRLTSTAEVTGEAATEFEAAYPGVRIVSPRDEAWWQPD